MSRHPERALPTPRSRVRLFSLAGALLWGCAEAEGNGPAPDSMPGATLCDASVTGCAAPVPPGFFDASIGDGGPQTADASTRDAAVPGIEAGVDASAPPPAPVSTVDACYGIPLPPRAKAYSSSAPAALVPYFPTSAFRTASPREAGMDPAKLEAALAYTTANSRTEGLIVLRRGYVVAEKYFGTFTQQTSHESFSTAKSWASAIVGAALEQGQLADLEGRLCQYYPAQWKCDDANDPRSRITMNHALNLRTGLSWQEDWRGGIITLNDSVIGLAVGMLDYTLSKPATEEPGGAQRYRTGDPALLSGALQAVTGKTVEAYGKDVLFGPLGINEVVWNADAAGRTQTFAGLKVTLRSLAKLGLLYANGGKWDGRQVVASSFVADTIRADDPCSSIYKNLFHINPPVRMGAADPSCTNPPFCKRTDLANLPADGFFAAGLTGQYVFVFPSADLVVARFASDVGGTEDWIAYSRKVLEGIFDAMDP